MPRSRGNDIVELFGYRPDDISKIAAESCNARRCPFLGSICTKTNHDQTEVLGVCSVTHGVKKEIGTEVIICPNRLYANSFQVLKDVIDLSWVEQNKNLIVGGDHETLARIAKCAERPIVAFGKNSGRELSVRLGKGSMSLDWVLLEYNVEDDTLIPGDFVGVEVQSIDITGNYRDNRNAYLKIKEGQAVSLIPDSGHGLNWANVHKRLIPQIIRKGNIYRHCGSCRGFFFIVPEAVFQRFEDILWGLTEIEGPSREGISVLTYRLGGIVGGGSIRALKLVRELHFSFESFALAFISVTDPDVSRSFEESLGSLLI